MSISRRKLVSAAGLAVAAGALGACSSTGDTGPGTGSSAGTGGGDGGPTTITFLNPHPGAYTAVIQAFAVAHPNIKIEEQTIPFNEMINQVQARLGSKDSSLDVVAVDPPRLPNMVTNGFLDEVKDPDLKTKVTKGGLESVTFEGKQYAYPIWTSDNIVFYNKELLQKAGVTPPGAATKDRMTWEDLLEAAKRVQAAGAQYGFGIEQIDRYYALQPMIMGLGGGTGLEGSGNLTANITDAGWLAFGKWYKDLHDSGVAPRGIDPSQMPELFGTGKVAYYLAGPTRISQLAQTSVNGKWGMAPHPYFKGKPVITPTDSWAMGVSAYSKKKQAGHTFLKFMALTTDGAVATSSNFNLPPVNLEAYPKFIERLVKANPQELATLDALLTEDNQKNAKGRPKSVGYVEFETLMNKSFTDIRNGADPGTVLKATQGDITRQLAKYK